MKKKLTSEEKEQIQEMLDRQGIEQAKKEQKLLKHKKNLKAVNNLKSSSTVSALLGGMTGAVAHQNLSLSSSRGLGHEFERRRRRKRAIKGHGLRQIKLTAEEKKELEARIRGIK